MARAGRSAMPRQQAALDVQGPRASRVNLPRCSRFRTIAGSHAILSDGWSASCDAAGMNLPRASFVLLTLVALVCPPSGDRHLWRRSPAGGVAWVVGRAGPGGAAWPALAVVASG